MADFPTPPLFSAPLCGNSLEFLDETYPTKTRRRGLPFGDPIFNRFYMNRPCDRQTGDSISREALCYAVAR